MSYLARLQDRKSMELANREFVGRIGNEVRLSLGIPKTAPNVTEQLIEQPAREEVKRWNVKEDIALRGLWRQGHSQGTIARQLNRSIGSISKRIDVLGLRGKGGGQKKLIGTRWSDGGAV